MSVTIEFRDEDMYSKLTLEKFGNVIFEKNIDTSKNGISLFFEMYKRIIVDGNDIIIEGIRAFQICRYEYILHHGNVSTIQRI